MGAEARARRDGLRDREAAAPHSQVSRANELHRAGKAKPQTLSHFFPVYSLLLLFLSFPFLYRFLSIHDSH